MRDINPKIVPEHELAGIRERGIKRAERRVEEREHLRLEIHSRKLIVEMQDAAIKLFLGIEESHNEAGLYVPLTRDRIAGLKAGADIADKLLKKVLPDLKQVELTAGNNDGEGRILENIELDNRMRLYLAALEKRGTVIPMHPAEEVVEAELVEPDMDFLN